MDPSPAGLVSFREEEMRAQTGTGVGGRLQAEESVPGSASAFASDF